MFLYLSLPWPSCRHPRNTCPGRPVTHSARLASLMLFSSPVNENPVFIYYSCCRRSRGMESGLLSRFLTVACNLLCLRLALPFTNLSLTFLSPSPSLPLPYSLPLSLPRPYTVFQDPLLGLFCRCSFFLPHLLQSATLTSRLDLNLLRW